VIEKVCFDIYLFNGKTKEKENLSANIVSSQKVQPISEKSPLAQTGF